SPRRATRRSGSSSRRSSPGRAGRPSRTPQNRCWSRRMADRGPLLIIGGHEDKDGDRVILAELARLLDGGRLVIATVASHEPEGYFDSYRKAFAKLGVEDLVELYVHNRAD